MLLEGNVTQRLSREQQERTCSTKDVTPGARGGSCPGRDGVLTSTTATTESKCSGSSDLPVVQVPGGDGGAAKTLLPSELLQKTTEKF